ncbi:TRAP transporter substrate-binding protein [Parvibium lacunae]|uniref:C4-dicarboxylate ABC transporter n=1 Tax=Parvibium lacunae TaxID=1888893 RepID=A0A368L184_9BURK|nr:TRAP transporter substrate-binding protein [Parvibium lacunae]RCS57337.1 C4-dicarboxylate ABC transporter [Parvibium lacunae]
MRRQFIQTCAQQALLSSTFAASWLAAPQACAAQYSVTSPLIVKFSHVVAEDTPKGKAALFFKTRLESLSRGLIRVEVYPNSQLYRDREELEALQLGAVQILAPSLAKFAPLGVREFEIFDLPFLFDDAAQMHAVTSGDIGKSLLKKLESRGIKGLAYWDNGFKQMSANKPLRLPDDLRGLKMRIQPSRVLDAQMRAVGATPQVTAFSEVYQTLQTGLADGTENPASNFWTQRLHEVQKYLTLSDHGYLGYAVIVNRKFWEGLDRDIRLIMQQAMDDATRFANEIARKENDEALLKIKAAGKTQVLSLSANERAAWRLSMMRVHQLFTSSQDRDLIRAIYGQTGFRYP